MNQLGDLSVFPLCLGGNVFGWTADETASFAVLDEYAQAGGNFIDTADVYSAWVDGHSGGESEIIIGRWLAARGNRDSVVIATKVGMLSDFQTLDARTVRQAAENSLRRLGTDHIDLYYIHKDDFDTPLEETLSALDALVREGKVREIAASNYVPERLAEALAISEREGFARYVALQPHYNLIDRDRYEGELEQTVARAGLGCVPYFGLARGFLTGKYRAGGPQIASPRAGAAAKHLDERGEAVLAELDRIADGHGVKPGAVALAWLAAQPTVVAPIASARTPEQLAEVLPFVDLRLTEAELGALTAASEK